MSYVVENNQAFYNPVTAAVQGDNEIWYTSSTNDILEYGSSCKFYGNSGMTEELTLQSNTYKDEIGKFVFDKPIIAVKFQFIEDYGGPDYNVMSLTLPKTIKIVGISFFARLMGLSKLIIPENVTSIGNSAFNYLSCPIIMQPIVPPSATKYLFSEDRINVIYVPDNSVDAYKTATGWSKKADIIKPMSEYVE